MTQHAICLLLDTTIASIFILFFTTALNASSLFTVNTVYRLVTCLFSLNTYLHVTHVAVSALL